MKKLLLLLPFLLVVGCEEKEVELTFEEKRIKAEEFVGDYTYEKASSVDFKETNITLDSCLSIYLMHFNEGVGLDLDVEIGRIKKEYTNPNYMLSFTFEDKTFPFIYMNYLFNNEMQLLVLDVTER